MEAYEQSATIEEIDEVIMTGTRILQSEKECTKMACDINRVLGVMLEDKEDNSIWRDVKDSRLIDIATVLEFLTNYSDIATEEMEVNIKVMRDKIEFKITWSEMCKMVSASEYTRYCYMVGEDRLTAEEHDCLMDVRDYISDVRQHHAIAQRALMSMRKRAEAKRKFSNRETKVTAMETAFRKACEMALANGLDIQAIAMEIAMSQAAKAPAATKAEKPKVKPQWLLNAETIHKEAIKVANHPETYELRGKTFEDLCKMAAGIKPIAKGPLAQASGVIEVLQTEGATLDAFKAKAIETYHKK